MRNGFARIGLSLCAVAVFGTAACSDLERRHGYVPTDEELEQVIVGVDDKTTIADTVGRPSAAGILADGGWYYVESTFETRALRRRETKREVVAITFDDAGTVENITRYGLEDGRVVALSRRVTDSNIEGIGFLRQLFGNIGNIDVGNILGG